MAKHKAFLSVGQHVVASKQAGEELILLQFGAEVEAMDSAGRVVLRPDEKPEEEPVAPGDELVVEHGVEGALCRVRAVVETIVSPGGEETLRYTLRLVGKTDNVQRRHFFRLAVSVPFRFTTVRLPTGYIGDVLQRRRAISKWRKELDRHAYLSKTLDLSGGGLSALTDAAPARNDYLFIELSLPDGPLYTAGRVVRGTAAGEEHELTRRIGVRFMELNPRDEARIVNYLFREESKRRRRQREEAEEEETEET